MIKKVLIAEDFDSYIIGIQKVLENLNIPQIDHVAYCDDAYQKIKCAYEQNQSYNLLITDLSFVQDYRKQNIQDGINLVKHCRELQPKLKIMVFSIENRAYKIQQLFTELSINAFVSKGRDDAGEIRKAIFALQNNESYQSSNTKRTSHLELLSDADVKILQLLAEGKTQEEIHLHLQKNHSRNSLRYIQDRLSEMRDMTNTSNNPHLISIAKDMGII